MMDGRVAKPPARGPPAKRPNSSEEPALPAKRARSTLSSTQPSGRVSPATLLRKRQIDADDDDDDEDEARQLKRARLTQQNLALFNKMGKKKEAKKASASAHPESTIQSSSTTRTTSTTSSGFALQAHKNGILRPFDSKPPENCEVIRQRLAKSRETASPPGSVYERYAHRVDAAQNEATMVAKVVPLLKEYEGWDYDAMFDHPFSGFPKDVGFNNGLSAPQPDFVEGLTMDQYSPFPVDEYVSGAALYKDDPYSMTLPHMAGEWKGRGKDMEEARLQSAYTGAALVYARNQAISTMGSNESPRHAEVTTFTTNGTTINFFAHYAAQSENGTLQYHQYPITSTNLTNSHQDFKQGRRQLRNGQDHAREQSYALRDQLKEHWKKQGAVEGLG
ncbi:hypothetical protein EDB80DRAFT_203917 [Ilyonectria destructans]|nr:hypothetical protein EDB80DRAFT_203917 [Ilyonectria destructans]